MYLWKAWRDCRTRVMVYILVTLSVGALFGLDVLSWANRYAYWMTLPHLRRVYNSDFYSDVTFFTLNWLVLECGPIAALLAGLSLGASSTGREYGAGTMNFVLTRPCSRRDFVLTDWTVGLTAMVIIVGSLALGALPFLFLIHAKCPGNVLAGLPLLWLWGAAIYGVSYFTTLVAGSAPKGLILSVATVLTYSFLPTALHEWWHKDALLKATQWTLRAFRYGAWQSPFDWSVAAFWLGVAAGFLGASIGWIRWRQV